MPRRCSRNTLPFESMTCQCGSGVSGTLKSGDRRSRCLPFCTLCVTVPAFTFAPANTLLVCAVCADAEPTINANVPTSAAANRTTCETMLNLLLCQVPGYCVYVATWMKQGAAGFTAR